jgi:hypothetical protein
VSDEVSATPPPPKPTDQEVVAADIRKYGAELVEGADMKLGAIWGSLAHVSPAKRAEVIAERLDGEYGRQHRNAEFAPRSLDNGLPPSELRRALERNADRLGDGQVDVLATKLAGQVAGKTPAQVAGAVEAFITSKAGREHLAERPLPSYQEQRLQEIMHKNFPELRGDIRASVLRDPNFRSMPESQVITIIAKTIKLPHTDPRSSGKTATIEYRPPPPAAAPAPTPPPTRNQDGTFSPAKPDEPTPPPRRKSLAG